MSEKNKAILEEANSAVAEGNYEGFLAFCTDDTEWTFRRFRDGKIAELKAFVIETEVKDEIGSAA